MGKTKISVSSASVRHASGLSFRTMVRMPGVKEICCMFITSCGIEYTCGNWCSTFLVENKNMPIANAAQVVMLYYIGLTLGRFCSGLLAVRLHSWKIIRLGQIVLGAGILLLFMPFLTTSVIGFFLIGFGTLLFPNLNHPHPENFGENISQNIMGIQMAASIRGLCWHQPCSVFSDNGLGYGYCHSFSSVFILLCWLHIHGQNIFFSQIPSTYPILYGQLNKTVTKSPCPMVRICWTGASL